MNTIERSAADLSLCNKDFYYSSEDYDYDCDGYPDLNDPSPTNPLLPTGQFSINKLFAGPTLGSRASYGVRLDQNPTRNLNLDFNLRIDHSDTRISRQDVIEKVRKCGQRFFNLIHRSVRTFQQSSHEINFGELQFNFNIYIPSGGNNRFTKISFNPPNSNHRSTNPSEVLNQLRRSRQGETQESNRSQINQSSTSANSENGAITTTETNEVPASINTFKIWKCFCSDCRNRIFEGIKVRRTSCRDDYNPAQSEILSRNNVTFRNRANASNLVLGESCAVFMHEFFHRFGIEDEYSDAINYPYNIVDRCNLMNSDMERIIPRQIMQILSPDRSRACELF